MADFSKGDRVVKMSGNRAGRYGTVNSVMENGTLNVTFDGERIPKWCDPARCGQVAANAKFKVGDKVVWLHFHSDSLSNETIRDVWKDGTYRVDSGLVSERELYPGHVAKEAEGVTGMRDIGGGRFASPHLPNKWFDLNGRVGANACAANAAANAWLSEDHKWKYGENDRVRISDDAARRYRTNGFTGPFSVMAQVDVEGREKYDLLGGGIWVKSIGVKDIVGKATNSVVQNALAAAMNAGRYELVEHNMGRSFGVYDSATSGYIADDIPLRDALRILKTKGETAEQAKKDLDWTDPASIDRLW